MNSKNYRADVISSEDDMRSFLEEQWMNMENLFIRRIKGFRSVGLGYKMKMPIFGRVLRAAAEGMIHSEKKHRNATRADGHFGQAIPLELSLIHI